MGVMRWLGVAAAVVAVAGVAVSLLAGRDVRARLDALEAERQLAPTRHGEIEYVAWGEGPPVVVLHGAGGGFDQGRLIAQTMGGEGFRWIAISRFGYLGSPLPADASTAAQADAIADLLDHLGVARAGVVGFSGGVPPALQFAERHPDRTAALAVLSSAPFTPFGAPEGERPIPDWLYQALFGNDAVYWALAKTNPGMLERAFDVRPDLRANLTPDEQRFVAQVADAFMPASRRLAGIGNEGAAIDPAAAYALERIAAPTLVIHARDDHINPFAVGATIAARTPNAEFVAFDSGGHLLLGHHAEVRARLAAFLADHVGEQAGD